MQFFLAKGARNIGEYQQLMGLAVLAEIAAAHVPLPRPAGKCDAVNG